MDLIAKVRQEVGTCVILLVKNNMASSVQEYRSAATVESNIQQQQKAVSNTRLKPKLVSTLQTKEKNQRCRNRKKTALRHT